MATCLLVYVPSLPLKLSDLMPQEDLALAAGYLRQAGHTVRIVDLGTASSAAPARPEIRGLRWLRGRFPGTDPSVESFVSCINEAIYCLSGGLDLVAFLVKDRDGLAMSTKINSSLQAGHEPVRSVCFGSYAERFAPYISAYNPVFDTVVAEEPGTVLSCMLNSPELGWSGVPGLMIRERGGSVYTGRVRRANHTAPRPLPDYSEGVYPQIHAGEKLRYFTIRNSATRSAITPSLMARARHVRAQFGGVPLHFEYATAQPAQVNALARSVASLAMGGVCSLAAPVPALAALGAEALRDLQCNAVSLELFSGSQRLLDDFFRAGFTVTEMEAALRMARVGGAEVHASFTYPCPWDDRHTEAETLRILERNRPACTTTQLPEIAPGTPWYADPDRFGFRLKHRHFARYAAVADAGATTPNNGPLVTQIFELGLHHGVGVHELLCATLTEIAASAADGAATLAELISSADTPSICGVITKINSHIDKGAAAVAPHHDRLIRAAMGN